MRSLRLRASKVPKPTTCTLPPVATSSLMVSRVAVIAFSTSFWLSLLYQQQQRLTRFCSLKLPP